MATKDQERKALAQIRKIVEGLGEDSYLSFAFEGCWEKAEQNIENDWACSQAQEIENQRELLAAWNQKCQELDKKIDTLKAEKEQEIKNRQSYAAEAQKQANRAATLEEKLEALAKIHDHDTYDSNKKEEFLQKQIEAKDAEIIRLKARLFDLMDK